MVEPPVQTSISSVGLNASLDNMVQYLWDLDENRLTPNRDYKLNVQHGKKPSQKFDAASLPLFTFVDRRALHLPTYHAFIALLDNYHARVGEAEVSLY